MEQVETIFKMMEKVEAQIDKATSEASVQTLSHLVGWGETIRKMYCETLKIEKEYEIKMFEIRNEKIKLELEARRLNLEDGKD